MRIAALARLLWLSAGAAIALHSVAAAVHPAPTAGAPSPLALDNGVRVIVELRPGSRTFSLRIAIAGGSCEDPAGQPGASTLLARMLLRSSETTGADERARRLESAGVTLDGSSGVLGLEFEASGPAEGFEGGLALLADALLHPRFDPAELERETALARQALVAAEDDPGTALWREALTQVFGEHCLARVPTDDPARWFTGVGAESLRRIHRERLAGSRMIIAVVGDLDRAAVEQSAGSHFGAVPSGTAAPAALPAPRPLASDVRTRVRRRTSQPEIFVALPTVGITDSDAPAMALLAHILGGFQERLSSEIREKRGWAYWVALIDWRWPGAGGLGVVTAVPRKHLSETEAIIRAELTRIANEPPSETEVERARRFIATQRARASQSSSDSTARLTRNLLHRIPIRSLDEETARDAAVTPADISTLARRFLDSSKFAVITLY